MIFPNTETELGELDSLQEIEGNLKNTFSDALMKTVLENDKKSVDNGKVLKDAINYGMSAFNPDLMFEKLVSNYREAEQIYGKKLISFVSGYDCSFVKRNIHIPEFIRELKSRLEEGIQNLKQEGLLDEEGNILEKGYEIAALSIYIEELDHLRPAGSMGELVHKDRSSYGERGEVHQFKQGNRYKDIALKASMNVALRRGHQFIEVEDLRVFERKAQGQLQVIYAMDVSGSMRGSKIDQAKKAGVALCFAGVENRDKIGLIVFNDQIVAKLSVGSTFGDLLKTISRSRPGRETNITLVLQRAQTLFLPQEGTKHLILLTDAMPTVGKQPQQEVLAEIAKLRNAGITTSIVGIGLEKKTRSESR